MNQFLDPAPDASIISGVGYPGADFPYRVNWVYDLFVAMIGDAAVFFFFASSSKMRDILV